MIKCPICLADLELIECQTKKNSLKKWTTYCYHCGVRMFFTEKSLNLFSKRLIKVGNCKKCGQKIVWDIFNERDYDILERIVNEKNIIHSECKTEKVDKVESSF